MAKSTVPKPQLISLVSGVTSVPTEPTDLRQQRIEEFLIARSLAPNSQKAYREDLARFTDWTNVAWAQVTPRSIAQYKAYLMRQDPVSQKRVLADTSVVRILQTLKGFLGWMSRSGYIDRDPTTEIDLPKLVEPEANNLSDAQVEAILNAARNSSLPERNLALLAVLSHGLRAKELCNLNIADFDGQRVKIQQAKADSKGTVPLDSNAQSSIEQYLDWRHRERGEILIDEDPLFVSDSNRNRGERISYNGIQKLMKILAREVGFDFHAHQFRHTFATNLLLQDMNPYHVMTLTRHKCPHNFRRYTTAADNIAAEKAFREIRN
jgi:integrase/recombinase XerD